MTQLLGAAADGDLELVRQLDAVPAEIELVEEPVGELLRVLQAVHADAPLQGTMGRTTLPVPPVTRPTASTARCQRLYVLIGDALDLHCQTHCHGYLAAAVFLGGVAERAQLLSREHTVAAHYADYKMLPVVRQDDTPCP